MALLIKRVPTTLLLALVSMLFAVGLGIPTGIISATRQYSLIDDISMVTALLGVSMPNFWQGLMNIIVFSIWLKWLPASGFYGWQYWILPALTIGTSSAALLTRMTRSSMLEVIRQDYIRTARAKGQKESKIIMPVKLPLFLHKLCDYVVETIRVPCGSANKQTVCPGLFQVKLRICLINTPTK